MRSKMSYPAKELIQDLFLVIDENTRLERENKDDITPEDARIMKKDIQKAYEQGNLRFDGMDSNWVWRLCAARLMRRRFSEDYCFLGWEYRSEWALNHYKFGSEWWPKWKGGDEEVRVLAEQGIGEEILFASVFQEFLADAPNATIEVDDRLIPVFERTINGNFTTRWLLEGREPPAPEHYDERGIMKDYESYLCCGDLLPKYRTGKAPPGNPYLQADPERVEAFTQKLLYLGDPPYIGISWKGGRSKMNPEDLYCGEGTYVSLQYKKYDDGIGTDPGPDWIHSLGTSHDDMEDVFALCAAMDHVVTTQNYIVHVCGSQGVSCDVIKPPPIFGEVGTPESDNNRLKWAYGIGEKRWTMPWYNSVTVYKNSEAFRECVNTGRHHRFGVSSDASRRFWRGWRQ